MERILQKRYRILRSLGRGGLGAVYLCDDLRLAGKQWALKQMHSPEPEMYERFRETFDREAATLSRLRHPNLPLIVDYFEQGTDSYLVMEYVEGENLAESIRRHGPMSEREAFDKGQALVDLLGYLHSQNPPIIFRDLKPENVMLTPDGVLKLVDFGLARRFVPGKRSDTVPSGSVGYAAPEQWEDLSQTDERSDIYSWGATMIHLVTGKIPSPVFPLSALRDLDPPLTERGRAILEKCLKARAKDRYPDANALANEVKSHLEALGPADPTSQPTPRQPPLVTHEAINVPSPTAGTEDFYSTSAFQKRFSQRESARSAQQAGAKKPAPPPPPKKPAAPGWLARVAETHGRGPLALVIVATIMYVGALLVQLYHWNSRPQPPRPVPTSTQGVLPYKPSENSELTRKAHELYQQKEYTKAIELLDQATTQYPDDAEAQIDKEDAYIRLTGLPSITIPCIASLTGSDSIVFRSQLNGLGLAQSTLNARGGIHGKKVVLDLYDDQSQTSECLQIAETIVKDPQTLVVLGPYSSQHTIAIAPVFEQAHVTMVAPSASADKVWDQGEWVVGAADTTSNRVVALGKYLAAHGAHHVAIVYDADSTISQEMSHTFSATVTPLGVTCDTGIVPYGDATTDFAPQVDAIARTHPDAVMLCEFRAGPTVRFMKQLRAAGLDMPVASQTIPLTRELVDLGGSSINGLLLAAFFHPQLDRDGVRAFVAAFHRKYDGPGQSLTPTHIAMVAYDAFMATAEALSHETTRQGVNDYLRGAGSKRAPFEGIVGPFAVAHPLDQRPVYVMAVEDGRFRLLDSNKGPEQPVASPVAASPSTSARQP